MFLPNNHFQTVDFKVYTSVFRSLPNIYNGLVFEETVKEFWPFHLYLKRFVWINVKKTSLQMYVFWKSNSVATKRKQMTSHRMLITFKSHSLQKLLVTFLVHLLYKQVLWFFINFFRGNCTTVTVAVYQ